MMDRFLDGDSYDDIDPVADVGKAHDAPNLNPQWNHDLDGWQRFVKEYPQYVDESFEDYATNKNRYDRDSGELTELPYDELKALLAEYLRSRKFFPDNPGQEHYLIDPNYIFEKPIVAGLNGDLPEGLEISLDEKVEGLYSYIHQVNASFNGESIGYLSWTEDRIHDVWVAENYRRRGVATAMLNAAQEIAGHHIYHSDDLSEDAESWADYTGGQWWDDDHTGAIESPQDDFSQAAGKMFEEAINRGLDPNSAYLYVSGELKRDFGFSEEEALELLMPAIDRHALIEDKTQQNPHNQDKPEFTWYDDLAEGNPSDETMEYGEEWPLGGLDPHMVDSDYIDHIKNWLKYMPPQYGASPYQQAMPSTGSWWIALNQHEYDAMKLLLYVAPTTYGGMSILYADPNNALTHNTKRGLKYLIEVDPSALNIVASSPDQMTIKGYIPTQAMQRMVSPQEAISHLKVSYMPCPMGMELGDPEIIIIEVPEEEENEPMVPDAPPEQWPEEEPQVPDAPPEEWPEEVPDDPQEEPEREPVPEREPEKVPAKVGIKTADVQTVDGRDIGPIYGWKILKIEEGSDGRLLLVSPTYRVEWEPGKYLVADNWDDSDTLRNTAGIHSVRGHNFNELEHYYERRSWMVLVKLRLAGNIIQHSDGYRSSKAKIVEIIGIDPDKMARLSETYGVPTKVSDSPLDEGREWHWESEPILYTFADGTYVTEATTDNDKRMEGATTNTYIPTIGRVFSIRRNHRPLTTITIHPKQGYRPQTGSHEWALLAIGEKSPTKEYIKEWVDHLRQGDKNVPFFDKDPPEEFIVPQRIAEFSTVLSWWGDYQKMAEGSGESVAVWPPDYDGEHWGEDEYGFSMWNEAAFRWNNLVVDDWPSLIDSAFMTLNVTSPAEVAKALDWIRALQDDYHKLSNNPSQDNRLGIQSDPITAQQFDSLIQQQIEIWHVIQERGNANNQREWSLLQIPYETVQAFVAALNGTEVDKGTSDQEQISLWGDQDQPQQQQLSKVAAEEWLPPEIPGQNQLFDIDEQYPTIGKKFVRIWYSPLYEEEYGPEDRQEWVDNESWEPHYYDYECLDNPDDEEDTATSQAAQILQNDGLVEPSVSPGFHQGLWYSDPSPPPYWESNEGRLSGHLYGFTPQEEETIWEYITYYKRRNGSWDYFRLAADEFNPPPMEGQQQLFRTTPTVFIRTIPLEEVYADNGDLIGLEPIDDEVTMQELTYDQIKDHYMYGTESPVVWAAKLLVSFGLTESEDGDWFYSPDGTRENYNTGRREEEAARVEGFTDEELEMIFFALDALQGRAKEFPDKWSYFQMRIAEDSWLPELHPDQMQLGDDMLAPTGSGMTWEEIQRRLGNRDSRKVGNNTYLKRLSENSIGLLLHSTYIIIYYPDHIEISTGGWKTVTTKDRLNGWLPRGSRLYQKNWEWYWGNYDNDDTVFNEGPYDYELKPWEPQNFWGDATKWSYFQLRANEDWLKTADAIQDDQQKNNPSPFEQLDLQDYTDSTLEQDRLEDGSQLCYCGLIKEKPHSERDHFRDAKLGVEIQEALPDLNYVLDYNPEDQVDKGWTSYYWGPMWDWVVNQFPQLLGPDFMSHMKNNGTWEECHQFLCNMAVQDIGITPEARQAVLNAEPEKAFYVRWPISGHPDNYKIYGGDWQEMAIEPLGVTSKVADVSQNDIADETVYRTDLHVWTDGNLPELREKEVRDTGLPREISENIDENGVAHFVYVHGKLYWGRSTDDIVARQLMHNEQIDNTPMLVGSLNFQQKTVDLSDSMDYNVDKHLTDSLMNKLKTELEVPMLRMLDPEPEVQDDDFHSDEEIYDIKQH